MSCCQTLLLNGDYFILGAPAVAIGATALMFGTLEAKKNCLARAIGYCTNRITVLTFALTGLPLLIYTLIKALFLKFLNVMTFKKITCLNRVANRTDGALKLFLAGYGAGLMLLANVPALMAAGRGIKNISSQMRTIFDSLKRRDGGVVIGDKLNQMIQDIQNYQTSRG